MKMTLKCKNCKKEFGSHRVQDQACPYGKKDKTGGYSYCKNGDRFESKSPKKFKWTVQIEIDRVWIEDGFDLSAEVLRDAILSYSLGYATEDEIKVKILTRPSEEAILRTQGFKR